MTSGPVIYLASVLVRISKGNLAIVVAAWGAEALSFASASAAALAFSPPGASGCTTSAGVIVRSQMTPTVSSATTAAPATAPRHRCSLSFIAAHAASFSSLRRSISWRRFSASASSKRRLVSAFCRRRSSSARCRASKRPSSGHIDDELEFRWLFDGQIGGLGAAQYFVDIVGTAPKEVQIADTVGHQTISFSILSRRVDRG